jgi:hypothetical protein
MNVAETDDAKKKAVQCTCMGDGFESLPPELRPRSEKRHGLRKVTCPSCGLVYSTNRGTDLCLECEPREATSGGSHTGQDEGVDL